MNRIRQGLFLFFAVGLFLAGTNLFSQLKSKSMDARRGPWKGSFTAQVTANVEGKETMLMVLLSFNFGIVFFDRNAMSRLAPFVQPDLKLTNEQVGLLASGLAFAWAISGFLIGTIADRAGHRKAPGLHDSERAANT